MHIRIAPPRHCLVPCGPVGERASTDVHAEQDCKSYLTSEHAVNDQGHKEDAAGQHCLDDESHAGIPEHLVVGQDVCATVQGTSATKNLKSWLHTTRAYLPLVI